MDSSNEGIFVIGATNQPWDVSPRFAVQVASIEPCFSSRQTPTLVRPFSATTCRVDRSVWSTSMSSLGHQKGSPAPISGWSAMMPPTEH